MESSEGRSAGAQCSVLSAQQMVASTASFVSSLLPAATCQMVYSSSIIQQSCGILSRLELRGCRLGGIRRWVPFSLFAYGRLMWHLPDEAELVTCRSRMEWTLHPSFKGFTLYHCSYPTHYVTGHVVHCLSSNLVNLIL